MEEKKGTAARAVAWWLWVRREMSVWLPPSCADAGQIAEVLGGVEPALRCSHRRSLEEQDNPGLSSPAYRRGHPRSQPEEPRQQADCVSKQIREEQFLYIKPEYHRYLEWK